MNILRICFESTDGYVDDMMVPHRGVVDIEQLEEELDKTPDLLNRSVELSAPTHDRTIQLTPLFIAALSGQVDAVKFLLKRGAYLKNEQTGEDLYTWTCLCPDRQAREELLDLIFKKDYRDQIHPNFPSVYHQIPIKGNDWFPIDQQELNEGIASTYPLTPFHAALLSNQNEFFPPAGIGFSSYRGMTPEELIVYRIAVFEILELNQFDVESLYNEKPQYNVLDKFRLAIQLGDIAKVKELHKTQPLDDEGSRAAPIFWAIKYGQSEILEYLYEQYSLNLNSDVIPSRGHTITLAYSLTKLAVKYSSSEVLEYLYQNCGREWFENFDFLQAIEEGQMQVLLFLDKHNLLHQPYLHTDFRGQTPLYRLMISGGLEDRLCKYFGFGQVSAPFLQSFSYDLQVPIDDEIEKEDYFLPLHLACLLKRNDEAQALIELGQSITVKANDSSGKVWDLIDFVLYGSTPCHGPLCEKEQRQLHLLQTLLDQGFPRETVLSRVRENCPRLFPELLLDFEKHLEDILLHKNFLTKILSGMQTISGSIYWKQGGKEREIEDLPTYIRDTISDLLGRSEIGEKKIPLYIQNELSLLSSTPTSSLSNHAIEMSKDKISLLCAILEKIHEISTKLAPFENPVEGQGPATIFWKPVEVSEDSDPNPKRQKTNTQ